NLATVPGLVERLGFQPLRWESHLYASRTAKTLWGKQTMTYLGTAGVYFGAALTSCAIFWFTWYAKLHSSNTAPGDYVDWWFLGCLVTNIAGLIGCVYAYKRLRALGSGIPALSATYRIGDRD